MGLGIKGLRSGIRGVGSGIRWDQGLEGWDLEALNLGSVQSEFSSGETGSFIYTIGQNTVISVYHKSTFCENHKSLPVLKRFKSAGGQGRGSVKRRDEILFFLEGEKHEKRLKIT